MLKYIYICCCIFLFSNAALAQQKKPKLSTGESLELVNVFDPEAQTKTWQVAITHQSLEEDDVLLEKMIEEKQGLRKNEKPQPDANVANKTDAMGGQLTTNFKACTYDGGTPSDNSMAISNSGNIVACANSTIDFYDTTGKRTGTYTLSDFAKDITLGFTFDPKVLYDAGSKRFIVVFLNGATAATSKLVICFSSSDNPKLKWNVYKLKGDLLNDGSWFDYPNIAVSKNDLFIGGNLFLVDVFGNNSLNQAVLLQIPKSDGYTGGSSIKTEIWSEIAEAGGDYVYGITPLAHGQDENYGPGIYCVATELGQTYSTSFFVIHVTDDYTSATKKLEVAPVNTSAYFKYSASAPADMKGTSTKQISVGDARVKGGFYLDSNLYFVFAADIYPEIWSSVVFIKYNVSSGKFAYTRSGKQYESFSYPNIASFGVNKYDQTVCIAYLANSKSYYPEIRYSVVDQWLQWSTFSKIKAGETYLNTLSTTTQRWGDYTGIGRWHASPCRSVWVHGMYAAVGTNNGKQPGNWIGQITNCNLTGISQSPAETVESSIYPNPTTDKIFQLEFKLRRDELIDISIIDVKGSMVKNIYHQFAPSGVSTLRFNEEMLTPGVYFIQIKSASGILKNEKLVIQ
jgi:hypothetical protein